jgi:hypothetical protein
MTKDKSINRLILGLLLVGLFFLFFLPPTDPDLGWQLRCGQQLWEQGKLCAQNTFSVLMANYYWPDARGLYQALIFPFYHFLGLFGLSLLNGSLMLAIAFFFLSLKGKRELKIILLPFVLFFSWSVLSFGLRNQLVSLFFLFLFLKIIELADKNSKWLWLSPLVMVLWANSHGGFVLGSFFLLAFLLERTIRLISKHQPLKDYWPVLAIVLFSLGATLLNPFGGKIYLEAWRHFSLVPLNQLIAEWVPPPPLFQMTILILTGLCLGVLYQTRKQPLTIFRFFVLFGLAFLALRARRDLAAFSFFSASILSTIKIRRVLLKPFVLLVAMGVCLFSLLVQLPKTLMIDRNWTRFCQIRYACEAVEWLKKQPEKGNIFNAYEQGGFLIWQLPEYKVFVDGRMPAWPHPSGKSPYTLYLETLQTQPGWEQTLKDYQINWLFISPGTFMDLKIRDNPPSFGWQEVYRDERAVIYQKI